MNKVIRLMESKLFIIVFSIFSFLCYYFKIPDFYLTFALLALIFVVIFQVNAEVMITILFIAMFSFSYSQLFSLSPIVYITFGISLLLLFFYIIKTKTYKIKGYFTIPIILFTLAGLLSGSFTNNFNSTNFFLLFVGITLLGVYFYLTKNLKKGKSEYFVFLVQITTLLIFSQVVVYFLGVDNFLVSVTNKTLTLGWGITNNIGMMMLAFLPITMFGCTKKKSWKFSVFVTIITLIILFLSASRGSLLVTIIMLPLYVLAMSGFINKKMVLYLVSVLGFFIIGLIIAYFLSPSVKTFVDSMIAKGLDDSGRFELYDQAFDAFIKNPIFGEGFLLNAQVSGSYYFYHSSVLQALASAGVIGLLSFLYLTFKRMFVCFKKLDLYSLAFLFSLLMSEFYGIADISINIVMMLLLSVMIESYQKISIE